MLGVCGVVMAETRILFLNTDQDAATTSLHLLQSCLIFSKEDVNCCDRVVTGRQPPEQHTCIENSSCRIMQACCVTVDIQRLVMPVPVCSFQLLPCLLQKMSLTHAKKILACVRMLAQKNSLATMRSTLTKRFARLRVRSDVRCRLLAEFLKSIMLPRDNEGYVQSYDPDDFDGILEALERYGVVVVHNVLNADAIQQSIDAIWSNPELESRGVVRENPQTWNNFWPRDGRIERKGWIESGDTMLCPCSWRNRFHPNVQRVFQAIWRHKLRRHDVDLRVKTDRYGVMRPLLTPEWRTDEGWLHTDQNPKLEPDFVRVQGILTFTDSTPETGGFICVPGFHNAEYADYCRRNPIDDDVCMLPDEERAAVEHRAEKVCARPGSLLVWDSRLPHANYPNDSKTRFRMVQYVTYYPSFQDSEKRARIRREDAEGVRRAMEAKYGGRLFTDWQFRLMGGIC
jgi:hypothetical protein